MYTAVNGHSRYLRETTPYPLRNNNNLVIPLTRTEISRKSCFPSLVSLWNSLDNDIRTADSLSSFKNRIKRLRLNNLSPFVFPQWRQILISATCTNFLNMDKLPFGDASISTQQNSILFSAVQNFIKDSRRFVDNL